jgi:DNA-binding transcriptional LysR family regulator
MKELDWNHWPAFLAMARTGRLTQAAQQLGVDHSTLSRRIAALEAALSVRLFDRQPRGFVLTSEGEALLADAEAMEAAVLRMSSPRYTGASGLAGTVRIGSPEGFGTYFLAPRLPALARQHPELHLELVANPRSFSLSKREADMAITMSRPPQGRVYAHKLLDFALGLYAAESYVHRMPPLRSRDDLPQQRWVGYVEDLRWTPELDYLPEVAKGIQPHLHISNVITQLTAVAGGAGIGVLPHFMARQQAGLVRLLPDQVRLQRSYWLVTHADTRDLARIKATVDFLLAAVRTTGPGFWCD